MKVEYKNFCSKKSKLALEKIYEKVAVQTRERVHEMCNRLSETYNVLAALRNQIIERIKKK